LKTSGVKLLLFKVQYTTIPFELVPKFKEGEAEQRIEIKRSTKNVIRSDLSLSFEHLWLEKSHLISLENQSNATTHACDALFRDPFLKSGVKIFLFPT
jgi:hypothetical protein